MQIERINIENCFNITNTPRPFERFKHTDGPVFDPHIFEPIIYKCQDCDFEIQFDDKNFQKHSKSSFSNLNKSDSDLIDDFVKNNEFDIHSFLDFHCPQCEKSTRIYYSDGYGGRHGDYIVNIDFALSVKK